MRWRRRWRWRWSKAARTGALVRCQPLQEACTSAGGRGFHKQEWLTGCWTQMFRVTRDTKYDRVAVHMHTYTGRAHTRLESNRARRGQKAMTPKARTSSVVSSHSSSYSTTQHRGWCVLCQELIRCLLDNEVKNCSNQAEDPRPRVPDCRPRLHTKRRCSPARSKRDACAPVSLGLQVCPCLVNHHLSVCLSAQKKPIISKLVE